MSDRNMRTIVRGVLLIACVAVAFCDTGSPVWAKKRHALSTMGEFKVLKSEPGTEFTKQAMGSFVLNGGTVLVEVDHPTEIRVRDCQLKANSGSTLLISLKNEIGSASVLTEKGDQSVDAVYGQRSLHLRSGRQVWFGKSEQELTSAIREAPGAPKLVRQYEAQGVGVIEEFRFAPATLMDTSDLVFNMKDSQIGAERELYADIVKTTAALDMLHH